MSIANKFEAKVIRFSEEDKKVYVITDIGSQLLFPYTFSCRYGLCKVFFDMTAHKGLWVSQMSTWNASNSGFLCVISDFWLEHDLPVPSVKSFIYLEHQITAGIADDFKDKLAAYVLDGIINSDSTI